MLITILQITAAVAGLVSAFYWWRSAEKPKEGKGRLPIGGSDGALAVSFEDTHTIYDFPKQSRLSARGAIWAAASILIQSVAVLLTAAIAPS